MCRLIQLSGARTFKLHKAPCSNLSFVNSINDTMCAAQKVLCRVTFLAGEKEEIEAQEIFAGSLFCIDPSDVTYSSYLIECYLSCPACRNLSATCYDSA